tara:strand:- start:4417 stop:5367 length:951 start_codon:yes stop_codon:yes gene_type:complete
MTNDYHAFDGKGLTRSQLWTFYNKGPAAFFERYICGVAPPEATALIEGQAFHALTLEGDEVFRDQFVADFQPPAPPPGEKAANYWKRKEPKAQLLELRKKWAIENATKKIIKPEAIGRILEMRDAAWSRANNLCFELLDGAETEVEFEARDEHTGMMLRSRVDILKGERIADLKSHSGNFGLDWDRSVEKYGYWFQCAFYERVTGLNDLHFLVVEKRRNPQAAVFNLDYSTRAWAHEALEDCLKSFAACQRIYQDALAADSAEEQHEIALTAWPGIGTGQTKSITRSLSSWFMSREEDHYHDTRGVNRYHEIRKGE